MLKNYKYLEHTISLCPKCLKKLDAKIVEQDGSVYVQRTCTEHGFYSSMLEEDVQYYKSRGIYNKPGNNFECQTSSQAGCPYDCGLCPEHEQHSCVGLIEVTNACNLQCPVCFACSDKDGSYLSKEAFESMLDFLIDSEGGKCDILQISGGEPTLHPDIIEMIAKARTKNIDYVMLNTNGIRIAADEDFVKELSRFRGRFELYLQFDGTEDESYNYFRGAALTETKLRALRLLEKYNIPTTLVATLKKGINDKEIKKIIETGLNTRCIRGINFQPAACFGRITSDLCEDQLTVSSVIRLIDSQMNGIMRKSDFIPLPCNTDRVAIAYFYKDKNGSFVPLTRDMDLKQYLPYIKNTFKFDPDDLMKEIATGLFTKDCCNALGMFRNLSRVIPLNYIFRTEEEKINFVSENTFRISITSFVDACNFDIKSAQKECVHVITPDLKKIPFSMYNLIHRK